MTTNNKKTALVTGGSRGIGAATVRRLHADGFNVAFTYSSSAAAAEALSQETGAKAYQADAKDPTIAASLVQEVLKDFGRIDVLVNNAGVIGSGIIGEIAYEDYRNTMGVNVDGVFALTNEVVKHLSAGARIINISSILGERAIFPSLGVYNASKFAVIGLTRSWAQDLGSKNILVNAILPGPIGTEMNPDDDSDMATTMRKSVPLGRYGKPEEIANAVAFLASPEASFINGAVLSVDGGLNA